MMIKKVLKFARDFGNLIKFSSIAINNVFNFLLFMHLALAGIASGIQWLSLSKTLSSGTLSSGNSERTPFYLDMCNRRNFFTDKQRKLCRRHSYIMNSVAFGASMAVWECQNQFANEPWNCSTPQKRSSRKKRSVFNKDLMSGTKEAAFVYALSSAAVAYSVTKDCSAGLIQDCGCDESLSFNMPPSKDFEWKGCSDNIAWGKKMSMMFVDAEERPLIKYSWRNKKWKKLRKRVNNEISINLYNNRLGRESISDEMKLKCVCHGVSGGCNVGTCWRSLNSFTAVGRRLKDKYRSASQVHVVREHGKTRLKPKKRYKENKLKKLELVYLRKSPSFCSTADRSCNPDSNSPSSCEKLCCSRGYKTFDRQVPTKCNCTFSWCCNVTCQSCNETVTENVCL